ncbi:pentapeptide repeat-containing protein [Amycolatopsis samaneae]|uniref:Pentapeptide repeat-containing protein n=1 Tax=Amycolatopsis samaneae TaxID=664691 RepID=A0ABW5GCD7_9PSEU
MSPLSPSPDPADSPLPPASPPMSLLEYRTPVEPPGELPVLSHRAMTWAAVALIVLGAGLAAGLLVAFGDGGHTAQLDAVKTAGTVVLGTGGAAALWLTARRQRTAELSLNQARATHAATVADAEARRITDLYGKAADQLGSAQAAVRLAGLYALERLAQESPDQRQTIVDLVCAYLRMPYEPPRREPARRPGVARPLLGGTPRRRSSVRLAPPTPRAVPVTGATAEAVQEHQVRRTAQAILFRHLRFGTEDKPAATFWPGVSLDLTGAVLGPANLIGCRVVAADFTGATFTGDVWFGEARFALDAVFTGVRFAGEVGFSGARFGDGARFDGATFDRYARFGNAEFRGRAEFPRVEFRSAAVFTAATFAGDAGFLDARFGDRAEFGRTRFAGRGVFGDAHFAGNAYFTDAEFARDAYFRGAGFAGAFTRFGGATLAGADFRAAEFGPNTDFTETRFTGQATFDRAIFAKDVEFVRARFEDGATFDGTRFAPAVTFTVFEDAEFGGDTWFHECRFGQLTRFTRVRFAADVCFEDTEFAAAAGFAEATFGGRAQFLRTGFGDVCGFRDASFTGDGVFDHVRFGGSAGFAGVDFARPPRIGTVWVRSDGRKPKLASTWPSGTVIRRTDARPTGADEGRWGLLVYAPSGETAPR